MGDKALGVIEIVPATKFYDYEAKYAPGGSKHLLPAPISPEVYEECRRLVARRAPRARLPRRDAAPTSATTTACRASTGLSCLEVNTQPGMTADLAGARAGGARRHRRFEELVRWMVEDASLDR